MSIGAAAAAGAAAVFNQGLKLAGLKRAREGEGEEGVREGRAGPYA